MDKRGKNELTTGSAPPKMVKCPICKKPAQWIGNPHRPFCSERCAAIDLANWADDQYSIEGEETDDAAEKPSEE